MSTRPILRARLCGIGVLGPGLAGYTEDSRAILMGRHPHRFEPVPDPAAALLPPNERRRSSALVRYALAVAEEAVQAAAIDPALPATVFASSGGEYAILDRICTALASAERGAVSPTLFHHSVHNAAAGYFAIATGSQRSTTALAAYDTSFAAGLIEAAAQIVTEAIPVLFVAYDLPPPQPLYPARPLSAPFALALVFDVPDGSPGLARLDIGLCGTGTPPTRLSDPSLEALRTGNPAARGLPLLAAIALGGAGRVVFDYLEDRHLAVQIVPGA